MYSTFSLISLHQQHQYSLMVMLLTKKYKSSPKKQRLYKQDLCLFF